MLGSNNLLVSQAAIDVLGIARVAAMIQAPALQYTPLAQKVLSLDPLENIRRAEFAVFTMAPNGLASSLRPVAGYVLAQGLSREELLGQVSLEAFRALKTRNAIDTKPGFSWTVPLDLIEQPELATRVNAAASMVGKLILPIIEVLGRDARPGHLQPSFSTIGLMFPAGMNVDVALSTFKRRLAIVESIPFVYQPGYEPI
jgi:hypothetical protein